MRSLRHVRGLIVGFVHNNQLRPLRVNEPETLRAPGLDPTREFWHNVITLLRSHGLYCPLKPLVRYNADLTNELYDKEACRAHMCLVVKSNCKRFYRYCRSKR